MAKKATETVGWVAKEEAPEQEDDITPVEEQEPLPTATLVMPTQATSAATLRQRVELIPIDGGKVWVEVRRVDLKSLVEAGKIPNPLMSAAIRIVEDTDKAPEKEDDETEEDFQKATTDYYEALNLMVMAVVKSPKLVMTMAEEEADPDVVWVGRILKEDRRTLLAAADATLGALNSFRDGFIRAEVR